MLNKKILIIIIFVFFIFSCIGCMFTRYKGYVGKYPELYSVAIHSLVGARGYIQSEDLHPSVVVLLEEDTKGRKLFSYSEGDNVSLLISQKEDQEFVYFYADFNFITAPRDVNNKVHIYSSTVESTIDNPHNNFTSSDINRLKELNDWDKEIDESKMTKVSISRNKSKTSVKESQIEELYNRAVGNEENTTAYRFSYYMTSDDYGRNIIYAYGCVNNRTEIKEIVMIIHDDGSYKEDDYYMVLNDLYYYQQSLKEFKELNDWNIPK